MKSFMQLHCIGWHGSEVANVLHWTCSKKVAIGIQWLTIAAVAVITEKKNTNPIADKIVQTRRKIILLIG